MDVIRKYQEHFLGISEFLEPSQAKRFLTLASGSDKHVQKALDLFDRLKPMNAEFLKGIEASSENIFKNLKLLGALSSCVVFSSNDWDVSGEIALEQALTKIVHHQPATIFHACLENLHFGKLAK